MSRTSFGRFGALLLAIWFAAATGGRATLHHCPRHDGPLPAHASHSHHQGHDSDAHADHCSCIHQCCAATASVAIAGSSSTAAVFMGAVASAPIAVDASAPQPTPDFSLPFSTGPPAQVA